MKEWYKKSFDNLSGNPPDNMWEGISSKLDDADQGKMAFGWAKYAGLGVVALIGVVGTLVLTNIASETDEITSNISDSKQLITSTNIIESSINAPLHVPSQKKEIKNNTSIKVSSPPSSPTYSKNETNKTSQYGVGTSHLIKSTDHQQIATTLGWDSKIKEPEILADVVEARSMIAMLPVLNGEITYSEMGSVIPRELTGKSGVIPEYYSTEKEYLPKGFYAGITYFYNNLWSLNGDTYDGFKSSSQTKNVALFKSSYGFVAGYNISDQSGVQAELIMNSQQGQKHELYDDEKRITNKVILNYSRITILYKRKLYRLCFNGLVPSSFNFVAGPYYASLELIDREENDEILIIENEYLDYDFGINLGLEYDAYLCNKLAISAGLNASAGLINIYKGVDGNKTNNLSFGASIGIKYIISD